MSERIRKTREELYQRLKANGVHWNHLLKQRGMFSYTGLTGMYVEGGREGGREKWVGE